MKRSGFPVWLVIIAVTLIFQPAHAANKTLETQKKPTLSKTPTAATTVKPLQKPIKLTPGCSNANQSPPANVAYSPRAN